jgi:HAD superfamily hydrolase (TIGR01549 family)
MSKNTVIVFDCDGTVLDTFDLIEKTLFSTFHELTPNYPLTKEEAHLFFGPLIDETFQKYATKEIPVSTWVKTYQKYNDLLTPCFLKVYDGIPGLLAKLKSDGYYVAMLSNKVSHAINLGLNAMKLKHFFDDIIGAECAPHKPDPAGLIQLKEKYQTSQIIMIGDSKFDIVTGQNAKCPTIGVTWCKTTQEEMESYGATKIANKPSEVVDLIQILLKDERNFQ